MNLGFAGSSVFGAAIGGALIAAFGISAALLVDAASFLVIAVLMGTSARLPAIEHTDYQPWHERIREGLTFVRGHMLVRTLLIGQALALVCFTVVVPIEVIYAKESLGTSERRASASCSAPGAPASCIGSLLFVALKNRSGFALIVVSTALIGLAYLGMSQAHTLVVACVMSVVGGDRQRRPVGGGDDRDPAVDAARVPGAHVRPAGVHRRGDARRRLPARRRAHAARLPADGVRVRGDRCARAGGRGADPAPRSRQTSTTTGKTIGRRLSRS